METKNLQDVRQTQEYTSFMEKIGWRVEKAGKAFVFIKKLPLFPLSVIKVLRYQSIDLKKLEKIRQKHRAFLVKQEPFEIEKTSGSQVYFKVVKKTNLPLIPTKTIWIDLTKSEKQLLSEMKQKTRYNLKKSQKNNLKTQIIPGNKITKEQINNFYSLWVKNRPYDFVFRPSFKELKSLVESFGRKSFFVFVSKKTLLASCLILTSQNMAFYWHNCSSKEGRKLFAPSLSIWEAIKESKKQKLKIFDFEGVWDERYPNLNKGWKGFTRFKLGFGN